MPTHLGALQNFIMWYKIVFDVVKLEIGEFFSINTNISTHGHPQKLYVHHNRLNVRKQFFCMSSGKCVEQSTSQMYKF